MKLNILKPEEVYRPPKCYELEIETMTGDADDYHSFLIRIDPYSFKDGGDIDLVDYILVCGHLKKNDRFWHDSKMSEDFWERLEEEWYHDQGSNPDSFNSYNLKYHDGNGGVFPVEIILEKADKKRNI